MRRVRFPQVKSRIGGFCTLQPPPQRLGVTHWSTRLLATELRIGHATIARAWRRYGVQPAHAGAPLGTPALVSPTPTAETSPSSSPLRGPSAEPSPPTSREERAPRQATTSALVAARDDRFVPGSITVEVGTTVVWRNEGRNPHTVTANDRAFDSGTLESGGAFQVAFEEVGTFAYYCQIHGEPGSGMTGVVRVVAAPDDPAEEGLASSPPDVLPRTGLGVVPLVLLALSMVVAGALALRVASAREGR